MNDSTFHNRLVKERAVDNQSQQRNNGCQEDATTGHSQDVAQLAKPALVFDIGFVPFEFEIPQEPEFEMGGGGLYSTMGDYVRFVRMILDHGQLDGERVLKPETVVQLGLNHMGNCRVTSLKAAIPLTNDAEFFPGTRKTWSLAFQVNLDPVFTGRPAGGLMWAGLANSFYWIDPVNGLGGVYATQVLATADVGSVETYYAFESAVYGSRR